MDGGNLWFYDNRNEILGILQDFSNEYGNFYATLFVKEPGIDLIEPLTILEKRSRVFGFEEKESSDLEIFELNFENGEAEECPNCGELIQEESSPKFLMIREDNFVLVISNANSKEYEARINYLNALYPTLSRIFLRSAQIQDILDSSEEQLEQDWKVTEFVAKRRYGQEVSVQEYPKGNIGVEEAYRRAEERDTWIDNMHVNSLDKRVRLRRDGIINLSFTNAEDILSLVFNQIREEVKEDYEVLASEEILEQEDAAIELSLERDYFTDIESSQAIKKELNQVEQVDIFPLTQDSEQPEYYLKDYSTGSVTKIIVTGQDKLFISPELYPSAVSIYKILTKISDVVEGEINVTKTQTV